MRERARARERERELEPVGYWHPWAFSAEELVVGAFPAHRQRDRMTETETETETETGTHKFSNRRRFSAPTPHMTRAFFFFWSQHQCDT